ncbi:MAG: hypothetical protein MJZ31_11805 [Bacteroidales bacterium]|nr:hypothetical protein [Bacteroidales bacterium]
MIPTVRDNIYTGHLTVELVGRIKKAISNHITNRSGFYVGITNDPERRNYYHYKNGKAHSEMVVMFQSTSNAVCKDLEAELVDYYSSDSRYQDLVINLTGGGGGMDGQSGPYYLYILLWD